MYIYTPNIREPIYKVKTDKAKGELNNNIIIVEDFNTPLSVVIQTINNKTDLNNTIDTNGPNRYMQNILSDNSRVHILLKCTWNIFWDRP